MTAIKSVVQALALVAGLTLGIALGGNGWFDPLLIITLLILLLRGIRPAIIVGLVGCILYETISPFPPLVFLVSVALTVVIIQQFLVHYVSHRSVLGVFATGAFGVAVFELSIIVFSKIGVHFQDGFAPFVTMSYMRFALTRVMLSTIVMIGVFMLIQRFSPRARGTVLIGRY